MGGRRDGVGGGNMSYSLFINTVPSVLKKNSFSSDILTEPQEGQLLVTPLNIRSSTLIYPFLMHQSLLSGMQVLFPLGQGGGGNTALSREDVRWRIFRLGKGLCIGRSLKDLFLLAGK